MGHGQVVDNVPIKNCAFLFHRQSGGFSPQLCVGFLFLILYPGLLLLRRLLLPPPPHTHNTHTQQQHTHTTTHTHNNTRHHNTHTTHTHRHTPHTHTTTHTTTPDITTHTQHTHNTHTQQQHTHNTHTTHTQHTHTTHTQQQHTHNNTRHHNTHTTHTHTTHTQHTHHTHTTHTHNTHTTHTTHTQHTQTHTHNTHTHTQHTHTTRTHNTHTHNTHTTHTHNTHTQHTHNTHTHHTHSGRRGTTWHPPSFHVAGVALMALGGALGLAWSPVTPGTPRHFAWQAWHKLTSTVVLRGRRGTTSHPPSFCVAGVALMALGGALGLAWSPVTPGTPRHFAWQAWHKLASTVVLRGRRGTTSHPPSFCVAGVALMALGGALGLAWSPVTPGTPRHFAWQAWHNLTSTFVSRGRRGTHGTGWRAWTGLVARDARDAAALCVAGVAQTHIHRRFAWQARHNLTSTVVLRGRRGTHGTGWRAWTGLVARDARDARDAAALCVAGVAQPDIHLRFTWQAWHSWHWVARLDWLGRPWRPGRRGTLRGRRGTNSHPPSFCVAGVAQPHIHCRFAWQAWHSWHWVARLDWLGRPWRPWRRGTLRGRRGTNSHPCLVPCSMYLLHTAQLCHTHTHTYIHTYILTYIRTYVHTDIHTYVHAYYLFTYFHTQSFTTSFVFPSFSDPATTFETHYWKKLTCGVIRSFNSMFTPPETAKRQVARVARLPGPTRLFRRAGVRPSRFPPVCYCIISGWWFQPLWTIWRSIGMIIPNIWKK